MQSWSSPLVPTLPAGGIAPRVRDTLTGGLAQPVREEQARIYVCGITPYDSTHLGHAATYIAFDTLVRAWRDAGLQVNYVQNVTDVDDPLLERARQTGVSWQELARDQVALYVSDMSALRVLAPDHYIGVAETTDLVAEAVARMLQAGGAYRVHPGDDERGPDIYADIASDDRAGSVGRLDEATMDRYFAERGGDPQVPGKKHPRDPLLWRAARPDEPDFDGGPLGRGRPGWHIECAVIAEHFLGVPFHVQGGGNDLIYPHHEMSTSHLRALTGNPDPASSFVHTGLVAYQGEKMSKSLGNLVFVSDLLDDVPPAAIRLAVLANHYSVDWEYTTGLLIEATRRLERWQGALQHAEAAGRKPGSGAGSAGEDVLARVRSALAEDLDTPAALAAVDTWADGTSTAADAALVADAVDALLGVDLRAGRGAVAG
ncbi:cysteine--1-D-myo-inosityl 2-amino-2-deoxy-alpha-D-glucopyranoside ligase [Pseudactinotalea sp. Z1739]|uniref:cysteine--1-D-myo-inosityl 2-amino-2-deoxy-alpha-D-glucopyranoside ligase n=1 Tax=Pseudactinotalea sp. Z1739 TaxID=3413028 RepID=UPI003C7D4618